MRILFIDTSHFDVSIAIIKDEEAIYSLNKEIPNSHSVYTISFIDEALKECKLSPKDIDKILIATGPGSFTGIRVGLTIAKVYGYLENIPLVPVSSLKMAALSTKGDKILSVIDAKNDNYYLGVYDNNYDDFMEEHFGNREEILNIINENPGITLISDKAIVVGDYLFKKCEYNYLSIVNYYKNKKSVNPHIINSNYLKLTSAEENLNK